jgi:NADPH-dependent 2,4-dienoyl-CoA reductase/sulfur reductase-like enzyme
MTARRRTARGALSLRVRFPVLATLLLLLLPLVVLSSEAEEESVEQCRSSAGDQEEEDGVTLSSRCRAPTPSSPSPGRYEYCVVGAGPGGLQVASMLREANVSSVVVFDKAPRAGQFFATFPIHRRLISINKQFFGPKHFTKQTWSHPEFQLWHDWNSLIRLKGGVPPAGPLCNVESG